MGLFNEKVANQAKDVLKGMTEPLSMTYFTQEMECEPCSSATAFVDEFVGLDERLRVEKKDFVADRELAEQMGIHHIPALVLHRPADGRATVRYYGVPGGYEFGAFLRTVVLFSSGRGVETMDAAALSRIEKETNLKVFVLVTCPSCPVMAHLAGQLAYASPRITSEIIEANTFVDLATRYTVGTVPKIVINDSVEIVGVIPPEEMIKRIGAV